MEELKNVNQVIDNVNNTVDEDVIVVDDGYKLITVQNSLGEVIGKFRFNPTDINIVNRYREISEQFNDVLKPLKDAEITAEGEAGDEQSVDLINEAEKRMIELMDYMLNCDSREAFFSKTHLFTPTDGNFYCQNVFDAVGQFISKKFDSEIKKISSRVDKHTHGYRTGKHRKGDR